MHKYAFLSWMKEKGNFNTSIHLNLSCSFRLTHLIILGLPETLLQSWLKPPISFTNWELIWLRYIPLSKSPICNKVLVLPGEYCKRAPFFFKGFTRSIRCWLIRLNIFRVENELRKFFSLIAHAVKSLIRLPWIFSLSFMSRQAHIIEFPFFVLYKASDETHKIK